MFDVRYKQSLGAESILLTENVQGLSSTNVVQSELSFAAGVAAFGMILRDSEHKGTADLDMTCL